MSMRPLSRLLSVAVFVASALNAATAKVTFHDVWPILERRCVGCHQAGGMGPMALTDYQKTRPWAAAIREAVSTGTMPPWHAAPGAHPFRNDRSLTPAEKSLLVEWVADGASEGDAAVKPRCPGCETPRSEGAAAWKLGAPDIMVEVPGFAVPAAGRLPYSFLIVPLHLSEDRWVRAAEFQVEQRAVIHHMNAFVRPPRSSYLQGFPLNQVFVPTVADRGKRRPDERMFDRRELLLGYEPGYQPQPWLEDGAKLIRAGSDLILEMHYSPNGKAAVDHTKIALYFAPTKPAYRVLAIDTLRDLDLDIPPNDAHFESQAAMTLGIPARLLSIQPHMHTRGASMEIEARYPDGREEMLLRVPHYDFGWQTTYVYRDPLPLPAGTKLHSTATFDNSANNALNPDPAARVKWGDQTIDEMHIAFLELAVPVAADADGLIREQPRMISGPPAGLRGAR